MTGNPAIWETVERHGAKLSEEISGLDDWEKEISDISRDKEYISKEELESIVHWKFTVGKKRAALWKYLKSNSPKDVEKCSRQAFSLAKQMSEKTCLDKDGTLNDQGERLSKEAIGELTQLAGVGPATASAVLAVFYPAFFCFMYDEAIDCIHSVRDYKLSTYLVVNRHCMRMARELNEKTNAKDDGWNTKRVAQILWIASRYNALFKVDLSSVQDKPEDLVKTKPVAGLEKEPERSSKRRRQK